MKSDLSNPLAQLFARLCRRGILRLVLLAGLLPPLFTGLAHASVAILLEQPYGGFGTWNPTGHSALYFDHICAATPTSLRSCSPGELGVVISRYDGIGTLDWVAVPLLPYLYAVDSPAEIPARADRLAVLRMRDVYRREHLEGVAPDTGPGGMPPGNWYELVGSAYNRTIYGFRVNTTPEQDAQIIAEFNDQPNLTRYSGAFRNCADFVRITIDRLYPHAIRRNYVADLGLTTPKSVARGLTHYGHKHPEVDLQVFKIPQVPGDLPRSGGVEGVTESLLKRYGLPLAILSPEVTAAVLVAYVGDGRFAEPKHAPTLNFVPLSTSTGSLDDGEQDRTDTLNGATSSLPIPDGSLSPEGSQPAMFSNGAPVSLLNPSSCFECF